MSRKPNQSAGKKRPGRWKPKYLRKRRSSVWWIFLIALLFIGMVTAFVYMGESHNPVDREAPVHVDMPITVPTEYTVIMKSADTELADMETTDTVTTSTVSTEQTESIVTEPTEPEQLSFLAYLAEKREQNSDLVGWIKIEGTRLDYPVMYTPEDPEKYLHLNINEKYSFAGLPFIDANCRLLPENDNLIIYAHNMLDGSMFRTLLKYENRDFWKKHPTIRLDIKDEEREYEIVSVFRDRVYYSYEDCFKFYHFYDAYSQEALDEAVEYYKSHAAYDTGVSIEMGDRMITLVTCASHTDNGRFVVVAREKEASSPEE